MNRLGRKSRADSGWRTKGNSCALESGARMGPHARLRLGQGRIKSKGQEDLVGRWISLRENRGTSSRNSYLANRILPWSKEDSSNSLPHPKPCASIRLVRRTDQGIFRSSFAPQFISRDPGRQPYTGCVKRGRALLP